MIRSLANGSSFSSVEDRRVRQERVLGFLEIILRVRELLPLLTEHLLLGLLGLGGRRDRQLLGIVGEVVGSLIFSSFRCVSAPSPQYK